MLVHSYEAVPATLISLSLRSMPFLAVDAIIGRHAFRNGRCHTCYSSGMDYVEAGYNLVIVYYAKLL